MNPLCSNKVVAALLKDTVNLFELFWFASDMHSLFRAALTTELSLQRDQPALQAQILWRMNCNIYIDSE